MIIYVSALLATLVFSILYSRTNNRKAKALCVIATTLPLTIISAIRYNVGTDYLFRYAPDYLNIIRGCDVPNLEIAFKILIKICVLFSHDYILLFIITSLIINYFIFKTIFKYSKNIQLSILLYFLTSNYFISMNLVRQYISMSILLYFSICYLHKNKIYKYLIAQLFSILFHTMSVVFVATLFLKKKIIKPIYTVFITIILFLFAKNIIQFIINLIKFMGLKNVSKYNRYISQIRGDFAISAFLIEIIIYIIFYLIIRKLKLKRKNIDKETIFYFNIQTICLIMIILSAKMELWNRIEIFFGIFHIISIPHFYSLVKNELEFKVKIFKNKINLSHIFYVSIILIFSVRMIYSVVIKGAIDVLPYRTIKSRPNNIYSEVNKTELYDNCVINKK